MDVLRSCYESEWRLIAGRPDLVTRGRYVFVGDDVPFYPGPTLLGSRNWTRGAPEPEPALGESWTARQKWTNGEPASGPVPAPALIGDADCIAQGERWPIPLVTRDLSTGFDSRCPQQAPPTPTPFVINVRNCRTQQQLAQLNLLLYTSGPAAITAQLQTILPGCTVTQFPNGPGAVPGYAIGVLGTTTVVCIAGTTNPTQWTLQIMNGSIGITNFTTFSTLLFWFQVSTIISTAIAAAGADPAGQFVLVGHSFGGAVACVLAARYLQFVPTRNVQLLTFGCPKPGDIRLTSLISTISQVHFINNDDPIPFLPPGGVEIIPFASFLPIGFLGLYSKWIRPTDRVGLAEDGKRTDNPEIENIYNFIFRILWGFVNNRLPMVFSAHVMSIYRNRIICPIDPAPGPIPAEAFVGPVLWWRPEGILPVGLGNPIDRWFDESGWLNDGVPPNPFARPTLIIGPAGWHVALFNQFVTLFLPAPFFLGNEATGYIVLFPLDPPNQTAGMRVNNATTAGGSIPEVYHLQTDYIDNAQVLTFANPLVAGHARLVGFRRKSNYLELWSDGAFSASRTCNPLGVMSIFSVLMEGLVFPFTGRCMLCELAFLPEYLNDVENSAWNSYLKSKFAIP